MKLAYIGAPCEVGACLKGASLAPQALRDKGFLKSLREKGFFVEDKGDIKGPSFVEKDPSNSIQFLEENIVWTKSIRNILRNVYEEGRVPLLIGGDHAVAMGSIMAAKEKAQKKNQPLHVLWFDAHGDFNIPETSNTGHIHGMPLAVVCGKGHDLLVDIEAIQPVVEEKNITLVGVRDLDKGERILLDKSEIYQVPMSQIHREGILPSVERSLKKAKEAGAHFHVSFDIDSLDAAEAPATGTPVKGGITIDQMEKAFTLIKKSGQMDSLDVVELNPRLDEDSKTTEKIKNLVMKLFE